MLEHVVNGVVDIVRDVNLFVGKLIVGDIDNTSTGSFDADGASDAAWINLGLVVVRLGDAADMGVSKHVNIGIDAFK